MLRAPPLCSLGVSSVPQEACSQPCPGLRPFSPHSDLSSPLKGRDQGWSVFSLYPSLKPAPPHSAHSAALPVSLVLKETR